MKISYKINFIDSFRFMSSSLSDPVNNLSEELHSVSTKIVIPVLTI